MIKNLNFKFVDAEYIKDEPEVFAAVMTHAAGYVQDAKAITIFCCDRNPETGYLNYGIVVDYPDYSQLSIEIGQSEPGMDLTFFPWNSRNRA